MRLLKIYKYDIPLFYEFFINLPEKSTILDFQVQNNAPYIWVLVDHDAPLIKVRLSIIGTFDEINDDDILAYVGTAQQPPFVWHLFMMKEIEE